MRTGRSTIRDLLALLTESDRLTGFCGRVQRFFLVPALGVG
jgi:hypothetical protein